MNGAELISQERQRQIEVEGWSSEHDDKEQLQGDLAVAGATYILDYAHRSRDYSSDYKQTIAISLMGLWPWNRKWWKPTPKDDIRQLTKAGALIAAEIDRLQRINRLDSPQSSGGVKHE